MEITGLEQYNIGLGAASTRTQKQKELAQIYTNRIFQRVQGEVILTDGSINQKEKKGGLGGVVFDNNTSETLETFAHPVDTDDAQEAELAGLLIATRIALKRDDNTTIICDCKNAINYLKGHYNIPFKYKEIVQEIQEKIWEHTIRKKKTLELIWIPGHTDNSWNDLADSLAKKAAHYWDPTGYQACRQPHPPLPPLPFPILGNLAD